MGPSSVRPRRPGPEAVIVIPGSDGPQDSGPEASGRTGHRACDDAPVTASTRTVPVPAARLPGWVAGFAARHGGAAAQVDDAGWLLTGADGAEALLRAPFGWQPAADGGADPAFEGGADPAGLDALAARLAAEVAAVPPCAVLVVRRGGYLVAVVRDGAVVASKLGRRHVQGRTAAGGWSQQRFARRRGKQTDELVGAANDAAVRVLGPHLPLPALATGGDRPLVTAVLEDRRLGALRRATRTASLAVGTPDRDTVASLPALLATVSVVVRDGGVPTT